MRRLTFDSAESIRAQIGASLKSSAELKFLHRLHALLLIAEGRSCYEVAKWFDTDARTVERWVHAADRHGVEGLRDHRAGGRPPTLGVESLQRLATDLGQSPSVFGYAATRWSGTLLSCHLRDRYAMRLGTRQCQRMLRECVCACGADSDVARSAPATLDILTAVGAKRL